MTQDRLHRELHDTEVRLEVAEQKYQRARVEREHLINKRAGLVRELERIRRGE
jgi:hypothetical protein